MIANIVGAVLVFLMTVTALYKWTTGGSGQSTSNGGDSRVNPS
jgi:hypothetical protein